MKLITWNVNGIRARNAELVDLVHSERPDVVCLQELKAPAEQLPTGLWEMEGYCAYWHGERAYSGVALLVRKGWCGEPQFGHPPFDYESRIVTVRTNDMWIASVYVPNGGKDFPAKMRFLRDMVEYVAGFEARGQTLLICGDLNVARTEKDVHPKERKPNAIGQREEERALLEEMLQHSAVDLGRALDPENNELFTWWAPWRNLRQRNIGWRLDYIVASTAIAPRASSCSVLAQFGTSDHAPVVAVFDLSS